MLKISENRDNLYKNKKMTNVENKSYSPTFVPLYILKFLDIIYLLL